MTPQAARRRAGLLLYAAVQFCVLTPLAMRLYADDYAPLGQFLSELGATRAWSGRPNHAAMLVFAVAVATLGAGFIAFAGAWSVFAFARGRARTAGLAAQWLGTGSGVAFVAVAFTPVDVALDLHNALVVAAFGLLLGYVVAITVAWAYNGAPRLQLAATATYLALVIVYFGVCVAGVQAGIATPRGREILVVSQKLFTYVSMLYVVCVTASIRRQLR